MKRQYRVGDVILGTWRIKKKIGQGGFGRVYEIQKEDGFGKFRSALKVINVPKNKSELLEYRKKGIDDDTIKNHYKQSIEKLYNEIVIMSNMVGNSYIVSYEDHFLIEYEDDICWDLLIRMELLMSLPTYIKNNTLTLQDIVKMGIDICHALELCHENNIIHRDIKPSNIFVSEHGHFKLGDFGVARTIEDMDEDLTKVGSNHYMAPEVVYNSNYSFLVDIYSLGKVLENLLKKCELLDENEALQNLVSRSTSYDPRDRFPSAKHMRQALETVLNEITAEETMVITQYIDIKPPVKENDFPAENLPVESPQQNIDELPGIKSVISVEENVGDNLNEEVVDDPEVMMHPSEISAKETGVSFAIYIEKIKAVWLQIFQTFCNYGNAAYANCKKLTPSKLGDIKIMSTTFVMLVIVAISISGLNQTTSDTDSKAVPPGVLTIEEEENTLPVDTIHEFDTNGFVRAHGTTMIEEAFPEQEYVFQGITFENNARQNLPDPIVSRDLEESYREVQELGFNSVTFLMNYRIFEEDDNPYQYKQSGWDWLDANIDLARQYNIRLVLKMSYPQGGDPQQTYGTALWTNQEYQHRLVALWATIAQRYGTETTIGAFELFDETILPTASNPEETIAPLKTLTQDIVDAIRAVDNNHLIIISPMHSSVNLETGQISRSTGIESNFIINDNNCAYSFDFFGPEYFTSQTTDWSVESQAFFSYPDENQLVAIGATSWDGSASTDPMTAEHVNWTEFRGGLYQVTNPSVRLGMTMIQCINIGEYGIVFFDEIVVKEYDEHGTYIRDILATNFDDPIIFQFSSEDGFGKAYHDSTAGQNQTGGFLINGTTSHAIISVGTFFPVQQGYHYAISGYAKADNLNSDSDVRLRIDFLNADHFMPVGKDLLGTLMSPYLEYGSLNQVPMYLGKFGTSEDTLIKNLGGDIWINDVIDICRQNRIGFNYYSYYGMTYGLYTTDADAAADSPGKRNDVLWNVFLNSKILPSRAEKTVSDK